MQNISLPVAMFAIFMRDDEVLLLKRKNTWHNDWKWSFPAWRLDSWETLTEWLIREAKEETWIEIKKESLSRPLIMNIKNDLWERLYFYAICREWVWKEMNMEPEKCEELKWFKLEELPENMIPHIRFALENILKWETYQEFGF
jgi:8-oxo-dGTP diphosphatase